MMQLNDIYIIIGLTLLMLIVLASLLNFTLKINSTKYDNEKKRIELEMMRSSLENNIYKETQRLTSDSKRFMDINHLLLESIAKLDKKITSPNNLTTNRFLLSSGIENIPIEANKVFVLTPFHNTFNPTYDAIAKVCNRVGLLCSRGDEEFIRGDVLSHILKELTSASIIIANIDGRNPNVFYELGIAHALDKDVILITSSLSEVPFDLQSQRLIIWDTLESLENLLTTTLTRLLINKN